MVGIYRIFNLANGKCYVGQSINIKKRWAAHRERLSETRARISIAKFNGQGAII